MNSQVGEQMPGHPGFASSEPFSLTLQARREREGEVWTVLQWFLYLLLPPLTRAALVLSECH